MSFHTNLSALPRFWLTCWERCPHTVDGLHLPGVWISQLQTLTVHTWLIWKIMMLGRVCNSWFFIIEICQKEGQVCHILELRHVERKFNPLPKARFLFTLPWFCHCPPHFPPHTHLPASSSQAAEAPAASGTKWQKLGLNLQVPWSLQLFLARL